MSDKEKIRIAKEELQFGEKYPYDEETGPSPDWAHSAARGVINDLLDRKGIKWAFWDVDQETRTDIVKSLAEIIRQAQLLRENTYVQPKQ